MDDIERLAAVEQRTKSNTRRIDKLEDMQRAIQELALSVRELATQMHSMKEEQAQLGSRLFTIETKPAKRLDGIVTAIISALCGALITAVVSAALVFVK